MSPDNISGMLELQPTTKWIKGSLVCRLSGAVGIASANFWALSTEHLVQSKNIEPHLDWLLDRLMPVKDQIISLQKVPGVSMRISCFWSSEEDNIDISFTAVQIKKLAELNMVCSFAFYLD
jgi:hypothetical protein